jgi:DNA-binding GntR family transcriptional regulator
MGVKRGNREQAPRYRQLADRLIGEIRRGRLKVGATLPGELELVASHGVSRHTVREALRVLDDLGLIDRHQGIGTVVVERDSSVSYVQTVRSPSELMRYPADSRLHVVATQTIRANRKLARLLGVRTGSEWLRVSALRRMKSSPRPIAWTDVFLLPEYGGIVRDIGKRRRTVYQLIEQRYGENVARVQVDIRAGIVTAELAGPLEATVGTPSLTVIRHYHGRGRRIFEISVSEHPADRYTYSLELQRGWQSADTWTTT